MKAKAVVATAPWKIEVLNVQVPDPGPQDVVVHVEHSWISNGTEGSFVRGERIAGDTPIALTDSSPFPHVPGYQKVGVVEWVGSEVKGFEVGQKVFATVSKVEGMFFSHAGHISPAVTHSSQIWKIPQTVEPLAVSGLVLTQVGYNCGIRPPVEAGDFAVVIGDGMVGHWTSQTLKHRGASVKMVGRHAERLNLFANNKEGSTTYSTGPKLTEEIKQWALEGVKIVVDTVGSIETIYQLMPVMKHDSHLVSAGFYGQNGLLDIQRLRNQEITLHTPAGWNKARMDETLSLIEAGDLQTLHLITHHFPVEAASDAFDLILNRRAPHLGVILDWELLR